MTRQLVTRVSYSFFCWRNAIRMGCGGVGKLLSYSSTPYHSLPSYHFPLLPSLPLATPLPPPPYYSPLFSSPPTPLPLPSGGQGRKW